MIEQRKFECEGYLAGVFGIKSDGKKYIYLWFSSGDLFLVDGDSLKQLSQLALDNCTISQMIAFKNTEFILASCSNGTLLVLSGPQF